jgi:thiol-disulfide isomerase/thioredoxin
MIKRISILFFIAIFFIACQTGTEDAKNFSDDYTKVIEKLREQQSKVKKRDDYVAFNAEKKRQYENLLKKYEKSPAAEKIEILRSRLLLGLEKTDEAEKKIDKLLAKKPDLITEAKMVKIKILLQKKQYDEAHNIFKEIEPQVKDPHDLYQTYYYLGAVLDDNKVKEAYAKKFIDAKDLPVDQIKNRATMYFILASIAKQEGDLDKARRLFNEGIEDTDDERNKTFLKNPLAQLDYYGKEAFPISAGTWFNSSPLDLKGLRGKVVVMSFWAPWCPSCRALTPSVVDIYNENKDQGLTVIGYSRLYGEYRDDVEDKGKVKREEELEYIKKYLERKKIPYPVLIAEDKNDYKTYKISGIPTLIVIDKKGNVAFTKMGGGNIPFVKQKIKQLLEET